MRPCQNLRKPLKKQAETEVLAEPHRTARLRARERGTKPLEEPAWRFLGRKRSGQRDDPPVAIECGPAARATGEVVRHLPARAGRELVRGVLEEEVREVGVAEHHIPGGLLGRATF
jgi:hypothetical protein